MYESRSEPLISRRAYVARLARSVVAASGLIAASLAVGVAGYHWLGCLGWIDSVQNASMILGGMGPVDRIDSDVGKLFASAYALFSGFALLSSVAVVLVPMVHRLMHRFHLQTPESDD